MSTFPACAWWVAGTHGLALFLVGIAVHCGPTPSAEVAVVRGAIIGCLAGIAVAVECRRFRLRPQHFFPGQPLRAYVCLLALAAPFPVAAALMLWIMDLWGEIPAVIVMGGLAAACWKDWDDWLLDWICRSFNLPQDSMPQFD